MRISPKFVLPACGLLLFGAIGYHSFSLGRSVHEEHGRYVYWGSIRLDSDPLNRHPNAPNPCGNQDPDCTQWDLRAAWIDPGPLEKALVITALPAFLVGALLVGGLGHLGVSQVVTFMISMPVLIFFWFYFIGLLVHRLARRRKRGVPG